MLWLMQECPGRRKGMSMNKRFPCWKGQVHVSARFRIGSFDGCTQCSFNVHLRYSCGFNAWISRHFEAWIYSCRRCWCWSVGGLRTGDIHSDWFRWRVMKGWTKSQFPSMAFNDAKIRWFMIQIRTWILILMLCLSEHQLCLQIVLRWTQHMLVRMSHPSRFAFSGMYEYITSSYHGWRGCATFEAAQMFDPEGGLEILQELVKNPGEISSVCCYDTVKELFILARYVCFHQTQTWNWQLAAQLGLYTWQFLKSWPLSRKTCLIRIKLRK